MSGSAPNRSAGGATRRRRFPKVPASAIRHLSAMSHASRAAGAWILACTLFAPALAQLEPGVDAQVHPGDDFFRFANGAWLQATPIPDGQPRWGARAEIAAKSGEVMSFAGRYFFIGTDGAVVQPASTTTVVKAVRRGDVVAIKQSGVVRRFIAIGIDADGGIVGLNQQGFHGNVQGFIEDLPGEWGPDPGGVLDCINQATEEGQECVASGGDTACCMAYQGLALLMCGVDIWGHDIADEDTPLEAGLGFAVAWDKPGGFIGKEALAQRNKLDEELRKHKAQAATEIAKLRKELGLTP